VRVAPGAVLSSSSFGQLPANHPGYNGPVCDIYSCRMPRRTKDAPGRVTPKGGVSRTKGAPAEPASLSGRYTAPIPKELRSSPPWYPYFVLVLFLAGIVVILLNYLGLIAGHANNWWLLLGLGLIVAGFIAATRWH
jgi:Cell division protein CrgA